MAEPDVIERLNEALEGRYRIERELGAGGMATVYLARDLRHERNVALKVLKPELAAVVGAERFLAEIKTTANLQHPHILPLFDSGEAASFLFYVMPYVEGESLREKLDREHQLPVDEAVRIATNVAEALEYAHGHGVIHRDIKPANILLQSGKPVVSDFGIALAVGIAGGGRLTETGLSLGTPHYMSPEQATGDQSVGIATDIYALGCVLYEMLVGEPPYTGSTAQAILGKIIQAEPVSATKTRRSVPANVDAAVRKALEKVSADRFRSAKDFAGALADPGFRHGDVGVASVGRAGLWNPLSVATAALAVLFAGVVGWSLFGPEAPVPVVRHVLSTAGWAGPTGTLFGDDVALAPDGSSMVLPLGDRLGLKMRNSTEIVPIPGTEGARNPTYSPDAQSIAYAVGSEVFKRPLVGGAPVRLAANAEAGQRVGISWLDDGTIVYGAMEVGLEHPVQISANGGEPLSAPSFDGVGVSSTFALPGARGVLVTDGTGGLYVADLRSQSSVRLLDNVVRAWYAPTGHLVYLQTDGSVFAAPFDLDALELGDGGSTPLFEGVAAQATSGDMHLGADGTLLYVEGTASFTGGVAPWRLVLVGRDGSAEYLPFEPLGYYYPRFSPDGRRVATAVLTVGGQGPTLDLWVQDLERGSRTRVTSGDAFEIIPSWTPDGERLSYADYALPGVTTGIYTVRADGGGDVVTLLESDEAIVVPDGWSPDGQVLALNRAEPGATRSDVWVLTAGGTPTPFVTGPANQRGPVFSPDGRWIAYMSDESGRDEVYVQAYPGPGSKTAVSTLGGTEPVWSRDGTELFYRTPEELMSVPVTLGETFRAGAPRPLFADHFQRDVLAGTVNTANYDVTPDGERFLMVDATPASASGDAGAAVPRRVILVQNFFEELRRLTAADSGR